MAGLNSSRPMIASTNTYRALVGVRGTRVEHGDSSTTDNAVAAERALKDKGVKGGDDGVGCGAAAATGDESKPW